MNRNGIKIGAVSRDAVAGSEIEIESGIKSYLWRRGNRGIGAGICLKYAGDTKQRAGYHQRIGAANIRQDATGRQDGRQCRFLASVCMAIQERTYVRIVTGIRKQLR